MEPIAIFGSQFIDKVLPNIAAAREEIRIVIYRWMFKHTPEVSKIGLFNTAILEAVARGVHVRVVCDSEALAEDLRRHKIDARALQSERMLHTKLLIVDRFYVVIGSHNYSQNAFENHYELSVSFLLSKFDNEYIDYFEKLWLS